MNTICRDLWRIFYSSFRVKVLKWHLLAIILTTIIVLSGFDWFYFVTFHNLGMTLWFLPAIIFGGLVPILGPLYMLVSGWLIDNKNRFNLGLILAKTAFVGWLISSLYKALTGRIQPNLFDITHDISREFNFGLFRHGIFWGWPSSHTTVAFAMSFLLIGLFPKNKILKVLAFIYAVYIGLGVSMSIHWFSEFVAGAIIGGVIGLSAVKVFRNQ